MSTEVGKIHYDLGIDTSAFEKGAKHISSTIGDIGKKMAIGLTVATGAVVAFGIASVKSFEESEAVETQLNAVLTSTGKIAGVTADSAKKLASQLQSVTKYSDETILGGENILLKFTKIGKDVFPRVTEMALNMATAMGTDVASSAQLLGKALNDPAMGMNLLRRQGILFTDKQKEVIEHLYATNRAGEAQALMLDELAIKFGGRARAEGQTFAGQLAILRNSFDDVKESIGKTIVAGLTPLASKLQAFVSSDKFKIWLDGVLVFLNENIPKALKWLFEIGIPALQKAFTEIKPFLDEAFRLIKEGLQWLWDNKQIIPYIVGAFIALKTAMFLGNAFILINQGFALMRLTAIASLTAVQTAFVTMAGIISLPIVVVLAVAGAILAIGQIYNASVDLNMELQRADDAIQDLNIQMDRQIQKGKLSLSQAYEIQHSAGYTGNVTTAYDKGSNTYTTQYASGTRSATAGLTLVGERGPEMVQMRGGEKVLDNRQTANMGGNVSIYGNINIGNKQDADNFFSRLSRNIELSTKGISTMAGTA